jgi:hypothetical protein
MHSIAPTLCRIEEALVRLEEKLGVLLERSKPKPYMATCAVCGTYAEFEDGVACPYCTGADND